MKAYKGFNPDMTCRGFQYKEGETYTEDSASLCNRGFHACEDPLDVFSYYPPTDGNGNFNKFHEVELEDVSPEKDSDTKRCAKKITIGAELNFLGLAKAHVEWVKEQKDYKEESSTGDSSVSSSTGYRSVSSSTGYRSVSSSTGYRSVSSSTGDSSIAVAWGIESKAKAAKGSYIALAEWKCNGYEWIFVGAKMIKIDGKRYKPDKFYMLKDGKVVEAKE